MTRRLVRFAAVAIALAALTACQNTQAPADASSNAASTAAASPTVAAEPKTLEAAKALAQLQFDLYSAGDWAGSWDLWTKAGKAAISRSEYERYQTECHTITGIQFEVTNARLETPTKAIVTFKRSVLSDKATIVYENGKWRYQPKSDVMAGYKKGVDALLKERRAEGSCS